MTRDASPSWRYEADGTKGSWEGADVGSVVSGFVVDAAQGEGPGPHTHPYSETFIVLEGRGRFRYGDRFIEAEAGAIVVVPPQTAHGFTGLGPGNLRLVAIHASPRMATTWLEDD
jgi:quercetin dioxygenase-like cupin family protein